MTPAHDLAAAAAYGGWCAGRRVRRPGGRRGTLPTFAALPWAERAAWTAGADAARRARSRQAIACYAGYWRTRLGHQPTRGLDALPPSERRAWTRAAKAARTAR